MRMRITSIIGRIEKHIKNARELVKRNLREYLIFNSLAMECFQAVNSVIDLGEAIISEKKLGFPSRYREIFEILYEARIIDKATLDAMKRLIFLRNLISHEYYIIKIEELKEMVKLLGYVEKLVKRVKRLKF